jgi:glycosyltransferase involved in cell wall biosynthesis
MKTPLRLSIVIPAYNEEAFIGALLARIAAVELERHDVEREVIVVDDGSRDGTAAIAEAAPGVRVIRQQPNRGKGRAVRSGIAASTGDYVLIQDADLEYEPQDYLVLIAALRDSGADIVYGSRYLRAGRRPGQSWAAYLGGRSLSLAAWYYTGVRLTDTVTALKLFPRSFLRSVRLETSGFELDHELTARALAAGLRIVEAPIRYAPRSKAEGKKIGARDWLRAVRTFRRYSDPPPPK